MVRYHHHSRQYPHHGGYLPRDTERYDDKPPESLGDIIKEQFPYHVKLWRTIKRYASAPKLSLRNKAIAAGAALFGTTYKYRRHIRTAYNAFKAGRRAAYYAQARRRGTSAFSEYDELPEKLTKGPRQGQYPAWVKFEPGEHSTNVYHRGTTPWRKRGAQDITSKRRRAPTRKLEL